MRLKVLSQSLCAGGLCNVIFNSRRSCATRVIVLGLSVFVCVCACPLQSAASHIEITKERYQQIHRNTGTILKKVIFFVKTFRSKVMA